MFFLRYNNFELSQPYACHYTFTFVEILNKLICPVPRCDLQSINGSLNPRYVWKLLALGFISEESSPTFNLEFSTNALHHAAMLFLIIRLIVHNPRVGKSAINIRSREDKPPIFAREVIFSILFTMLHYNLLKMILFIISFLSKISTHVNLNL